jgi:hypothetical protein
MPAGDCLAVQKMREPEEQKARENVGSDARRNREDVLRDIKLALAIDGLGLDERRHKARGVDPYDSVQGGNLRDPWSGRRRG